VSIRVDQATLSHTWSTLLVDLTRAFGAQIELDELLPLVLRSTRSALRAASTSILLLDEKTSELYFPITSDLSPEIEARLRGTRFPADRGIAGAVLRTGVAEHVMDVASDPRFYEQVDRETGTETQSLLCAPLRTQYGTIGVVQARNHESGSFSRDDLAFLDALADSIAVALNNSRQYERLRHSEARFRQEVGLLRREKAARERFPGIIGASSAIRQVFSLMESAITSDIPVLVHGETGVGKEGIARAIHEHGARSGASFVAVNCSALQETLLESELFGVRRGAFTGAHADRPGLLEAAEGGTLFLDEIAEMSPALQAKFLRALEDGEVRRVGDIRGRKVDLRIIAATNRDLESDVQRGRFREDLFYRIHVFAIRVPPLRERRDDVPALAGHFLGLASRRSNKEIHSIQPEAVDRLVRYDWPGNVRQLENEIERAVALAPSGSPLALAYFSEKLRAATRDPGSPRRPEGSLREALRMFEREHIEATLAEQGGNVTKAASSLGLSRQQLHRRMKDLGLR
jgi:Nif-specific regulatory protein